MNNYYLHFIAYLVVRYLHIVCATVLVGGTLFYEMIVPAAIDDLKHEQQLLVFARARWFFKWIVWLSAGIILISGVFSTFGHWNEYQNDSAPAALRPGWWWAAHASCGVLALLISLSLTIGKAPPIQPIRWMRLNLIILLLVIFLATVTRQTRLENTRPQQSSSLSEPPESPPR